MAAVVNLGAAEGITNFEKATLVTEAIASLVMSKGEVPPAVVVRFKSGELLRIQTNDPVAVFNKIEAAL